MNHYDKRDFPLLAAFPIAYLDNAATAQRPECVIQAENTFYRQYNANPLRGLYPLSVAATRVCDEAREAVCAFIHAGSSDEIIFTRNTTESLNLVAYSYGLSTLKTGDEIVVSIMEHHSNLLPWQWSAARRARICASSNVKRTGASILIRPRRLSARGRGWSL